MHTRQRWRRGGSRTVRAARKRKRRMDRVEHDLSDEQWTAIKTVRGGGAYCGATDVPLQRDCVLPISRGGRYTLDNIVPACRSCNASKCNDEVTGWLRRKKLDERSVPVAPDGDQRGARLAAVAPPRQEHRHADEREHHGRDQEHREQGHEPLLHRLTAHQGRDDLAVVEHLVRRRAPRGRGRPTTRSAAAWPAGSRAGCRTRA